MSTAEHLTQASYLAAAALFILSLRWLSDPKTARRGVGAVAGGCGGRRPGGRSGNERYVDFPPLMFPIVTQGAT